MLGGGFGEDKSETERRKEILQRELGKRLRGKKRTLNICRLLFLFESETRNSVKIKASTFTSAHTNL